MILKRPPFWAAFPFFDFPPCGQRLFCAPPGRFGFAALRLASLLRAPLGRFQCAAFGGIDCRVTPRRAVLDLPRCARRGFHGNCRLKSGKKHERVPPRATGSFSDGRKGTKSPPKNPSPWAACPGIDALLACGERRRAATRIQRGPQAPFGFPVGSRHATRPEGPES